MSLRALLKPVSRSFYFSIQVLPANLRRPITIAYLIARAADTIADNPGLELDRQERLKQLLIFREWLLANLSPDSETRKVELLWPPAKAHSATEGEWNLLNQMPSIEAELRKLSQAERRLVGEVLFELVKAMEFDLHHFQVEKSQPVAVKTLDQAEAYTYWAAGCVGKFWTDLAYKKRARCRLAWRSLEDIQKLGVSLGKALQWTNIARDFAEDLHERGRCYIPQEELTHFGLEVKDLLDSKNRDRFKPLYNDVLQHALNYFDEGWLYIENIPARERRLKLASVWPLLIGLKTLQLLAAPEYNPLDPGSRQKISKKELYQIFQQTSWRVFKPSALKSYYSELRDFKL